MSKKYIYYVSSLMEEKIFEETYKKEKKAGQQIQKFNRLIVQGLRNNDAQVRCLTALTLSPALIDQKVVRLKNSDEYLYLTGFNIPILKNLHHLLASFFHVLFSRHCKACVIDPLSVDNGYGTSLACRIRGIPVISIITDLPEHMADNKTFVKMTYSIIQRSDGLVFLTQQANDLLNTKNKPWALIEGLVADPLPEPNITEHTQDIIFAGGINRPNGVPELVHAFKQFKQNTYTLRLFGNGKYEEELKREIENEPNIRYEGSVLNSELMPILEHAALLINPRPVGQDFTDYTFPSKTMEYMSCNTYSACTRLPGIPAEYFNYIGDAGNGSVESTLQFLNTFSKMSEEERNRKAKEAFKFVKDHKNCTVQSKKILDLLDQIEERRKNA